MIILTEDERMENELFEKTPVPKAYFTFALPVVFSMVVSLVYNMVDTYFIAQTGNTNLVAGVSLSAPVFTLMIALGDIFGLGGSSLISRLFGEKKDEDGKRLSVFCFYAAIVCGILVTAVMMMLREPILYVLGADAAIATVIGNIFADIFYVWFLLKRSRRLSINPAGFHIHIVEVGQILAIGIPASITNLMQSIGIALTNRSLLPYGNDKVAAMGIVMKVNLIAVLVLVGFAFGAQPLVGYNYGAKNHARLKEILRFSYSFECCTAAALAGALSLAAPAMIGMFMQDAAIIEVGVPMLRMQQMGMVFTAVVLVTTCTFQSAGKAVGAFLLSVSRQGVLFAAVLFIASKAFAYQGVLMAQAVSDLLTAVMAVILFEILIRRPIYR